MVLILLINVTFANDKFISGSDEEWTVGSDDI